METVVLEHSFTDEPFDLERYNVAKEKNAWCFEQHDVRHLVSYLTPDRRRMVCVFEAPDAEAVRRLSRQLGYAYDGVWTATVLD